MKVFKFGGASVKDAKAVRNLLSVLQKTGEQDLVVVVSAMGKTTNHMEHIVNDYFDDPTQLKASVSFVKEYHYKILEELFPNKSHEIYKTISRLFSGLDQFLERNKSQNHAYVYDQVVSIGELISTSLVSVYLAETGLANTWVDARQCIITDANHRDAKVNWKATQDCISEHVTLKGISLTQGFIGAEQTHGFTTTLGREGSDYTAAIFAYCLNAESVTIWKDVPGVLNADPRYFTHTRLLHHISYREAIELAFYGASVIHPKTLQPLQRKEIPLYAKSFVRPEDPGTRVGKGVALDPQTSCFILKKGQVLISLSSLDFSFMMEDNISEIFRLLHEYRMKVELIQNSAISFSVCVDNKFNTLNLLIARLNETYKVTCHEGVTIYTVRHSTSEEIKALVKDKEVLLRQENVETVQVVVKG